MRQCNHCGETKPRSAFSLSRHGNPVPTCRDCRRVYQAEIKRVGREAYQASPTYAAHLDRVKREREAKELAKAYRQAEREAERLAEAQRRSSRDAEQINYYHLLVTGQHPTDVISDQQSWDAAMSALQRLWLQSGDKVCNCCGATVPPEKMQSPGPANSYPGHCRQCSHEAYEDNHRRTSGLLIGPLRGPRLLALRDGTFITIAELARRHREREAAYRHATNSVS